MLYFPNNDFIRSHSNGFRDLQHRSELSISKQNTSANLLSSQLNLIGLRSYPNENSAAILSQEKSRAVTIFGNKPMPRSRTVDTMKPKNQCIDVPLSNILSLRSTNPRFNTPPKQKAVDTTLKNSQSAKDTRIPKLRSVKKQSEPSVRSSNPRENAVSYGGNNFTSLPINRSATPEPRARYRLHKTYDPARFVKAITDRLGGSHKDAQRPQTASTNKTSLPRAASQHAISSSKDITIRQNSLGDFELGDREELDQEISSYLQDVPLNPNGNTCSALRKNPENPLKAVIKDVKRLNRMSLSPEQKNDQATKTKQVPAPSFAKSYQRDSAAYFIEHLVVPLEDRVTFERFFNNPWVENMLQNKLMEDLEEEERVTGLANMNKALREELVMRQNFLQDIETVERRILLETSGQNIYRVTKREKLREHGSKKTKLERNEQIHGESAPSSSRTRSSSQRSRSQSNSVNQSATFAVASEREQIKQQAGIVTLDQMIANTIDFSNKDKAIDNRLYKNFVTKPKKMKKEDHIKWILKVAENKKNKLRNLAKPILEFLTKMDKMGYTREHVINIF